MARKKNFDFTKDNPYEFFTRGRSRKAIEMDYSKSAKPPTRKECRVNRSDYPGEDEAYLAYFKKHNITPPKKKEQSKTTKKKKTTPKKKTTTKKKISEPQITEKEPQVGDIIKLKSGRIDKIIKVIPEDDWHFKRYMTQELNPPAGQEPKIGKLYYKPDTNGVRDFEIIEQNPEKKIIEKTTQKKVKEPKKVNKTPEPEKEQKKYRDYNYVDVVYFTPKQFEKLEFLYETTLPNKKDKAYCYMSADENSDEYNFYLFFNKNRQEAYQISIVQMLAFNDPSDKERKERVDRFTDIAAKLYEEKNKIETSETTKKVSKKTPVKKSTTKISNPKDYPTLMAMRVKEKIIKDHNRCDFTKEEIEEAVDLSIRRGNETQGQIVKDAINILFATSK